jgi:hypothetical protein
MSQVPQAIIFGVEWDRVLTPGEFPMRTYARLALAVSMMIAPSLPAFADGFTNCTKSPKASWRPKEAAEAAAKKAGYEVRRSKIEGSCYEVYGVKNGKLFEVFYSPEDLSVKHTQQR